MLLSSTAFEVMLHTHGLGGECNRNICAVVFESMLSPHKHVLTLGLPAFCQCRTYLASRETAVFLVMRGACMSAVVGQVHMSARLLFRYVCCDMLQQDSGRCDLPAHACSVFRGPQHCFLGGEVCDDRSRASQLHCVRSI